MFNMKASRAVAPAPITQGSVREMVSIVPIAIKVNDHELDMS